LRVGEGAPAGRNHEVTRGELFHEHLAFDRAEIGLAMFRENLGHRRPLLLLDELVDVHRLPVETLRQRTRQRGLSGRHEADEIHLVCFHGDPQDRRGPPSRKLGHRDTETPRRSIRREGRRSRPSVGPRRSAEMSR